MLIFLVIERKLLFSFAVLFLKEAVFYGNNARVAELVDALDSKSKFEKGKKECRSGGIGRHDGFKIHCSQGLRVRFPPSVLKKLR
tara:strand:- start:666 stop:920 length:255 start_codon:yes stop_codon:yes gene_type:complete